MDIEDSEEEGQTPFSDSEEETNKVAGKPKGKSVWAKNPHEDSPCAHSHQDQIQFLRSLSIMPQYQELINITQTLSKVVGGIIVILYLLMVNIFIEISVFPYFRSFSAFMGFMVMEQKISSPQPSYSTQLLHRSSC